MNKANILVVDDEQINIEIISELLSSEYHIKVAFDGKKALEIVDKLPIDLILLDINMPNMNGYEVAEQLKSNKNTSHIPFIFITAKQDQASVVKGFRFGAVDYILKPFNKEELFARVSNHIKTHNLQKSLVEQKEFTQTILDMQPNMIIVTDGLHTDFANQSLLDFFGCKDIDEFIQRYKSIADTFMYNDLYFHLNKGDISKNWIERVLELKPEERIVATVSKSFTVKALSLSIKKYKDDRYIINLHDISETMLRQLEYKQKATLDNLTGAFNREYFETVITNVIEETISQKKELGIIILDIDHFKNINDTYGHNIGDEVLVFLSQLVQKNLREEDILIRWGGEEFIMVVKISTKEDFISIAEGLREKIETTPILQVSNITASFGMTFYKRAEEIKETIQRADEALYTSKQSGRNKVTFQ